MGTRKTTEAEQPDILFASGTICNQQGSRQWLGVSAADYDTATTASRRPDEWVLMSQDAENPKNGC